MNSLGTDDGKRYASQKRHCKSWIERNWNIWNRSMIQTLLRYYFYKRLKWNFIGIPRNSQPNDILSTYAIQKKTSAAHGREIVVLESK